MGHHSLQHLWTGIVLCPAWILLCLTYNVLIMASNLPFVELSRMDFQQAQERKIRALQTGFQNVRKENFGTILSDTCTDGACVCALLVQIVAHVL